jgi:hypothetical protein
MCSLPTRILEFPIQRTAAIRHSQITPFKDGELPHMQGCMRFAKAIESGRSGDVRYAPSASRGAAEENTTSKNLGSPAKDDPKRLLAELLCALGLLCDYR